MASSYNCASGPKIITYTVSFVATSFYLNITASSSRITDLQSECDGRWGSYYAYSTCYFVLNVSASQSQASAACSTAGGQLAALFGPDLVVQLG